MKRGAYLGAIAVLSLLLTINYVAAQDAVTDIGNVVSANILFIGIAMGFVLGFNAILSGWARRHNVPVWYDGKLLPVLALIILLMTILPASLSSLGTSVEFPPVIYTTLVAIFLALILLTMVQIVVVRTEVAMENGLLSATLGAGDRKSRYIGRVFKDLNEDTQKEKTMAWDLIHFVRKNPVILQELNSLFMQGTNLRKMLDYLDAHYLNVSNVGGEIGKNPAIRFLWFLERHAEDTVKEKKQLENAAWVVLNTGMFEAGEKEKVDPQRAGMFLRDVLRVSEEKAEHEYKVDILEIHMLNELIKMIKISSIPKYMGTPTQKDFEKFIELLEKFREDTLKVAQDMKSAKAAEGVFMPGSLGNAVRDAEKKVEGPKPEMGEVRAKKELEKAAREKLPPKFRGTPS